MKIKIEEICTVLVMSSIIGLICFGLFWVVFGEPKTGDYTQAQFDSVRTACATKAYQEKIKFLSDSGCKIKDTIYITRDYIIEGDKKYLYLNREFSRRNHSLKIYKKDTK